MKIIFTFGTELYTHTNKQRAIQANTRADRQETNRQTDNVNKVTVLMFSEDGPLGKQYITQTYTHKNEQMITQMNTQKTNTQ